MNVKWSPYYIIFFACDTAQYATLIKDELSCSYDLFTLFNRKVSSLDEFFFNTVKVSKYNELSTVLKLVLTISHGQAAVERGFSHNKYILAENMKSLYIVSQRVIKDHMVSKQLQPYTITISSEMLSVKGACSKYQIFLDQQRMESKKKKVDNQLEIIASEEADLKNKQELIVDACTMLDNEFVDCVNAAEKENNMQLVIKANALKRKSNEKIL